LSVIVPCRNERAAIERFIAGVLAQEEVSGGIEVLVADGRSDDGTREILKELTQRESRLVLIDNPRRTVSPGLNLAIRQARAAVIARMDVHTEYAPDYLRSCLEALELSSAQNVGGPALTRAEGYFQRANAAAYGSAFAVGGARFHAAGFEGLVDTVPYGCWRKTTLEDLGYFDEALDRNQDDELNLRLIRRGGSIWQTPGIRSWYRPRSTATGLFRQYFQYGYWKVYVIRKHRTPASWRHLVPVAAVLMGILLLGAGLLMPAARVALAVCALAWLGLSLVAAAVACRRSSQWDLLPALPLVFAIYHVAYGLGFLRALLDHAFQRGPPGAGLSDLTR
jgi:glycosyltransferase involved in cell wall biosynthesis